MSFKVSEHTHDPSDHIDDNDAPVLPDDEELLVPDPLNDRAPISVDTTPLERVKMQKAPPWCPKIQAKLRQLLIAMYTQLPGPEGHGQFFSVFMRWLVLSSVRPSGLWLPLGSISQRVAALLFAARLTMLALMDDHREAMGHFTHHE